MNSELLVANGMSRVDGYLAHFGKGHLDGGHSGRFPWGSGKDPKQSEGGIGGKVKKALGLSPKDLSTPENRKKAFAKDNGALTNEGRKRYAFDAVRDQLKDAMHKSGISNISGYDLYTYYTQGLDGFTDKAIKKLGDNLDLLEAMNTTRDMVARMDMDGITWKNEDRTGVRPQVIFNQIADEAYNYALRDILLGKVPDNGMLADIMQYDMYGSDYLAHYGRSVRDGAPVGSGRFHLGSGEDPYQMFTRDREDAPRGLAGVISKLKRHGGGTATAAEKKLLKQQLKIQKAEFKSKKAAEEAERKAKEEEDRKRAAEEAERQKIEDTKRQIEDRKFQLLRTGDMKQILENQQLFTTQELQGALDRANRLEQIQAKMPKQKSALDRIDAMFGAVGKAANWIDTGAKFAKSIKNMQELMNPDAKPQQKMTIGQQYAAKLLAGISGKSLDEIDFNKLGADMKKVNTVNDLYNMAAKGVFKGGGGSDGKIKDGKQNDQNQQNKDQNDKRIIEGIKKDKKNAEPIFKDDQPSKKEQKDKQKAQEQELRKRENERKAAEQEKKNQEKANKTAEKERQRQEEATKRAEQERQRQEERSSFEGSDRTDMHVPDQIYARRAAQESNRQAAERAAQRTPSFVSGDEAIRAFNNIFSGGPTTDPRTGITYDQYGAPAYDQYGVPIPIWMRDMYR